MSPEELSEYRRADYLKHRERKLAKLAEWRDANREHLKAYNAAQRSIKRPAEVVLYWNARNRAKAKGIEFGIEVADISVPSHCPILGIPLAIGTGYAKPNSPSIDRIDPSLGYVRGNIAVISHKANTIKSNASLDEIEAVCRYMRGLK